MIKTINGWTKEKMKTRIRKRNNGKKSLHKTRKLIICGVPSCAYRGKDNNACAVGCFIPNSKYKSEMDNMKNSRISVILSKFKELKKLMPLSTKALSIMQAVHDNSLSSRDIREILCDWIDENVVDGQNE